MTIEHVGLYVRDLEEEKRFFERYFGAVANEGYLNRNTGFQSFFLRMNGGARLELMCRPGMEDQPKPLYRTGFAHLALSLGGRAEVDSLTQRLREDGFTVLSGPRVTGDGYYESCVLDPEGNQIELTE